MLKAIQRLVIWLKKRTKFHSESGQMLLFVLIVLLLLTIILFAIIVNVRIDIRETQLEREYEEGYSVAEEELFKIYADSFSTWSGSAEVTAYTDTLCPSTGCEASSGPYTCFKKCNLGEEGEACVVVKRCVRHEISGMTINQDETLEVDLGGQNASAFTDINVSWNGAPAISLMVVYRDGGEFKNARRAVCRESPCYSSFEDHGTVFPLDIANDLLIPADSIAELLRIRAIGADAYNISVTGSNLPPQMEEIRVQGLSAGLEADIEKGLPGPEVYTLAMIDDRLPGLFDYVLFVADRNVMK